MQRIIKTQITRLNKCKRLIPILLATTVLPFLGAAFLQLVGGAFAMWGEMIDPSELAFSLLSSTAGILSAGNLLAAYFVWSFLREELAGDAVQNAILTGSKRSVIFGGYLLTAGIIGVLFKLLELATTVIACYLTYGFGDATFFSVLTACFMSLIIGLLTAIFMQSFVCLFTLVFRKKVRASFWLVALLIIVPSIVEEIIGTMYDTQQLTYEALRWLPLYNVNLFDASVIDGALAAQILLYILPLTALLGWLGILLFEKSDVR